MSKFLKFSVIIASLFFAFIFFNLNHAQAAEATNEDFGYTSFTATDAP